MADKKRLEIRCPELCSFHPEKIGPGLAATLMEMRANGAGSPAMQRRYEEIAGHKTSRSNMDRHVKHYREIEGDDDPHAEVPETVKMGDLDILDRIIQQGARNSHNWKPTIKDTIEAMKLKMQITGNSAFDNMLAAMEAGLQMAEGVPEDEIDTENIAARLSEDEREPEDELPEPLL